MAEMVPASSRVLWPADGAAFLWDGATTSTWAASAPVHPKVG